jgi:hypothetical protein
LPLYEGFDRHKMAELMPVTTGRVPNSTHVVDSIDILSYPFLQFQPVLRY